jgi:D-methionine transport system ATP-binding protein
MEQSQIITLKDVDSSYAGARQEHMFLKGINLTVNAGETLGVIGRAGAGKSALLRCIALIERPLTGIISIDSKNLTYIASRELVKERRSIGIITNKPRFLLTKSISKNIALPLKLQKVEAKLIQTLVAEALADAELENKADALATSLTAVQKIQLDLARCLVNKPKILLCDDIFLGLDQKSCETLINIIRKLQQEQNLTVILTTNDAEIIKALCHNVIVMQKGMIVEKCTILELFTRPQSDTAKDFIRFTTKHELPLCLRRKVVSQADNGHHAIVRVNFTECLAPEEILSNTLEAYDLKMNIIQAYQEKINEQVINIMLLEIFGENATVQAAINFLNDNSLQSEIIGYVPNSN